MAIEVGTAYVSILPSTSKLAPAIRKELGAVEKDAEVAGQKSGGLLSGGFGKAVKGQLPAPVSGALDDVARTAPEVGKKSGGLLSGALGGALKVGGVAAGAGLVTVLGASLGKGLGRLKDIDEAEAKLKGLGHSGKSVGKIMDSANAAVSGTAFGMGEAASVAANAVAAGVKPGKELERTLKLTGDAATIAGTDMGSMGSIFNKVAAGDMLQGDAIAQLQDQGIPILQLLSKEMGVSATEVKKLASQGKVDFATFQDAVEGGMGGAAQEAGKTFSGSLANVGAAMSRLGAAILAPAFKVAPYIFMALNKVISLLAVVVTKTFNVIGTVIKAVWDAAVKPALTAMAGFIVTKLIPPMKTFRDGVVVPVFTTIGQFISVTWSTVIKPVLNAMKVFLTGVVFPVIRFLFTNVVAPIFKAIGVVIRVVWNGIIKPVFNAWKFYFTKILFPVIRFLFNNVIRPTFKGIGAVIRGAWNRVIKPVFAGIKFFLTRIVFPVFRALLNNVVRPVFNGIGKVVRGAWNRIRGTFGAIGKGLKKVGGFFTGLWDTAKSAFGNLVDGIGAVPGRIVALAGKFKDAGKKIIRALIDGLKNAGKFVSDIAGSVWRAIKGMLNKALDKVRSALNFDINLPGPAPDIHIRVGDAIPRLAKGGRAHAGTLAVIGEGKEPESVLPDSLLGKLLAKASRGDLDGRRDAVGGGSEQTKSTLTAELDAKKFKLGADQLTKAWKSQVEPVYDGWTKAIKTKVSPAVDDLSTQTKRAFGTTVPRNASIMRKGVGLANDGVRDSIRKRLNPSIDSAGRQAGRTFGKSIPDSANTMGRRVRNETRRTGTNMVNFGKVAKDKVAPAFGRGVNAIGEQWSRIRNKTKGPVRYVVGTVLNGGLLKAFNKVAKFVDTDTIKKIGVGFRSGGFTGRKPVNEIAGVVHGNEHVIQAKSRQRFEHENPGLLEHINRRGTMRGYPRVRFPGFRGGGLVSPDKRVTIDGEPMSAVHAAQLALAARLGGVAIRVMQGSWQPATSYSGTSHTGPGVADTSPGSWSAQSWLRKVGIAAWARNIPGAAYAGSGAHIHGISMLSPGAAGHSQLASYRAGGNGLGGSDYGPRPPLLPGLTDKLRQFGQLVLAGGLGVGMPVLPRWAQKIVSAPKKWAEGFLGTNLAKKNGAYGKSIDAMMAKLVEPAADWATGQLGGAMGSGAGMGGKATGSAQQYAMSLLPRYGWGRDQFGPLRALWNKESNWRWNADNPTSSAYGIPQALPGSKMASAGADWRTNPSTQIRWGLGYIKGRYGSPAAAWAHSQSHNWYGDGLQGGIFTKPTLIGVGEKGPERVDVTPLNRASKFGRDISQQIANTRQTDLASNVGDSRGGRQQRPIEITINGETDPELTARRVARQLAVRRA